MLQFYSDAFFCEPPTVLGRKLRPYSLGHSFILEATASPFVTGGPVNAFELIGAVLMCSIPFRELVDKINTNGLEAESAAMGKDMDLGVMYAAELAKFNDYLRTYDKAPPAIQKKAETECPVPWQFIVAWRLMERIPEDRAWDMPLSLALAYNAAWRWEHGDETLLGEDAINTLKIMSADMKKEQATNG